MYINLLHVILTKEEKYTYVQMKNLFAVDQDFEYTWNYCMYVTAINVTCRHIPWHVYSINIMEVGVSSGRWAQPTCEECLKDIVDESGIYVYVTYKNATHTCVDAYGSPQCTRRLKYLSHLLMYVYILYTYLFYSYKWCVSRSYHFVRLYHIAYLGSPF